MLLETLMKVEDPRSYHGREYRLHHILYFTILAILQGVNSYVGVHRFLQAHFEKLKSIFGLKWRQVPDPSAIRKIITRVDPEEIERVFREYSLQLTQNNEELRQICFDGKALCGSFSRTRNQKAQRFFAAFSRFDRIILAHIPLESEKDHEIPALHEFLLSLNLKGVVVTADALHCQKKTFELADKAEAIFITQVKENQKTLLSEVAFDCSQKQPLFTQDDGGSKEQERIERRLYEVFETDLGDFAQEWPWLKRTIRVTRWRHEVGVSEPSVTKSYYVTNGGIESKHYPRCIRNHWDIENRNNYVRDFSMREDFTVKRKNPQIFATCLSAGLNIMRRRGDNNIKGAMEMNGFDFERTYKRYDGLL